MQWNDVICCSMHWTVSSFMNPNSESETDGSSTSETSLVLPAQSQTTPSSKQLSTEDYILFSVPKLKSTKRSKGKLIPTWNGENLMWYTFPLLHCRKLCPWVFCMNESEYSFTWYDTKCHFWQFNTNNWDQCMYKVCGSADTSAVWERGCDSVTIIQYHLYTGVCLSSSQQCSSYRQQTWCSCTATSRRKQRSITATIRIVSCDRNW